VIEHDIPLSEKVLSETTGFDGERVIHPKQMNGRASDRRVPGEHRPVPCEMLDPTVLPRTKEADDPSGVGIDACDVRALVRIAVVASQSEVF